MERSFLSQHDQARVTKTINVSILMVFTILPSWTFMVALRTERTNLIPKIKSQNFSNMGLQMQKKLDLPCQGQSENLREKPAKKDWPQQKRAKNAKLEESIYFFQWFPHFIRLECKSGHDEENGAVRLPGERRPGLHTSQNTVSIAEYFCGRVVSIKQSIQCESRCRCFCHWWRPPAENVISGRCCMKYRNRKYRNYSDFLYEISQ